MRSGTRMPKKYHILSVLLLLGFTLCLTNGFADENAFPWEDVIFPTPEGDAYIQGTPEFQRVPAFTIGAPDYEKMRNLPKNSQDYRLGGKVGMITVPTRYGQVKICTGFLVGPDLFLTNHHCIHDRLGLLPITGAKIYMDYYQDHDVDATLGGVTANVSAVLRTEYFKDYALLRLDKSIGNTYGWLDLNTTTRVDSSQSVKLMSHNQGRSKEIVRRNTEIVDIPADHSLANFPFFFAYLADSEGGASGSPIFLRDGTSVIGIHHSGWFRRVGGRIVPEFNAGTLMSHIVPEIQQWLPGGTPPPPPPKPSTKLMYWTDMRAHKIWWANLDGTNVQTLVRTPFPWSLALDVTGGKIYWIEGHTHKIRRANLDGTNPEDLITAGLLNTDGLALDVTGGKIYWMDATNPIGKIQRANLNGTNVEDLLTGLGFPISLALDVTGGKMYWTDRGINTGEGKIQRANLNGTNVEDLLTGLQKISGIALDATAGKMYWTDTSYGKIRRANLNGTNVEDLVNFDRIEDIALDVAAGKMYWTDTSFGAIWRTNLDGTNSELVVNTESSLILDIALYLPGQQAPRPPTRPPTPDPTPTLRLSAVADQTFTVGTPVNLTLPSAIGGTSPYTYSLSPIPAGLRFDSSKRELSGTPTTTATTDVKYTATDASEQTASLTFTIRVTLPPLSFNPSTVADQTFTVNTPITPLTLPQATGGTLPYTYTLSPLPAGFSFDSAKRELSGTPTTPGATNATYTATSASEQTASLTFTITVTPAPLSFNSSTVADQTFTVNTPITPLTLPQATGGTPPYTYTLSPIPPGLDFTAASRRLSGTPTTADTTSLTYTATGASRQNATLRFTITVIAEDEPDSPADVNADGQVTVIDLVVVSLFYGTQVPEGVSSLPADVNADGIVNLLDLTAVAQAIDAAGGNINRLSLQVVEEALEAAAEQTEDLEEVAAAPMRFGNPWRGTLQDILSDGIVHRHVAAALADAKHLAVDDRLLGFLQRLAEMAAIPETTALLPNYPNPFNPETWIPYHLAMDANVTLTIYDIRGVSVRQLVLGHQPAGVYESRRRAAYWDGRNQLGEKVASGLYFYTLTADEFNATRKLFIAK